MSHSYVIIRDGQESHRLDITHRDWGLLTGPFFDEGPKFIDTLGVYEHFTVAGGIPKGSHVTRQRLLLLDATQSLFRAVQRDEDLLRYDYSYSFAGRGNSRNAGAESGFRVRGFIGHIDTRPHGYCHLQLSQLGANDTPRVVEFVDMRVRGSIETDELGLLKVGRRKSRIDWLETLPPLIEFLHAGGTKEVTVGSRG